MCPTVCLVGLLLVLSNNIKPHVRPSQLVSELESVWLLEYVDCLLRRQTSYGVARGCRSVVLCGKYGMAEWFIYVS